VTRWRPWKPFRLLRSPTWSLLDVIDAGKLEWGTGSARSCARNPTCLIGWLTALADVADRINRASKRRATYYVVKAVQPKELEARIFSCLRAAPRSVQMSNVVGTSPNSRGESGQRPWRIDTDKRQVYRKRRAIPPARQWNSACWSCLRRRLRGELVSAAARSSKRSWAHTPRSVMWTPGVVGCPHLQAAPPNWRRSRPTPS